MSKNSHLSKLNQELLRYGLIYEYPYWRAPFEAMRVVEKYCADSKVLVYGDGSHTREFLENKGNFDVLGIIADVTQDPWFARESFELPIYDIASIGGMAYDYIILLGYWSSVNRRDFAVMHNLDEKKLFSPYTKEEMVRSAKDHLKIDFQKTTDKPTLCLVLINDARDFVTVCSEAISSNFELVKVFINGSLVHYDNKYFSSVYNARGNFADALKMIEEINPNIVVYFHTGPYENIRARYLYAKLKNKCKIVYATTDIFFNGSFEIDHARHAKWLNASLEEIKYLEETERLAVQEADGVVTNWGGEMLEKPLLKNVKSIFVSSAFQEKSSFVYQRKQKTKKISLCHTGNVAFNARRLIHKVSTLDKIFESLLGQGFEVHLYHAQLNGKFKEPYGKLVNKANFYWHDFVPTSKLPKEISGFHYGINLLNLDDKHLKIYNTLFGSLFQAKMITYIAAGLPIIVADEFRILKDFVCDNRIGISVRFGDINRLADMVKKLDYENLVSNVLSFRKKYLESENDMRLAEYLQNVLMTKRD